MRDQDLDPPWDGGDPRPGPIINVQARRAEGPPTPTEIVVDAIASEWIPPQDALTGSLPILGAAVAAIEASKTDRGGKHAVERTSAEARRHDLEEQFAQVEQWWQNMTEVDISATLPKALEYGSGDLDLMGQAMLMMQGDVWEGGDEAEKRSIGQELAILFYIQGKVSRALSAAKDGQRCSEDTIADIRIYSVMLQRVRETGKWVG